MADWAGLIPDTLFMIATRIEVVKDFHSFRSVCSTWKAATLRRGSTRSLKPLQGLVLNNGGNLQELYSFTRTQVCKVSFPEETKGRKWFIETNGWILTVSQNHEMSLAHPFSRHVIKLPSQTAFGDYYDVSRPLGYVQKVVLSGSPHFSPDDFIVMVIHGSAGRLGFWKNGDETWTVIKTHEARFKDIVHCRGQFYAVDNQGVIYECDVKGCNPTVVVSICSIPIEKPLSDLKEFYLVGSSEKIDSMLLVVRDYRNHDHHKYCFKVYEVDLSATERWEEVRTLGAKTIFVSRYGSLCTEYSKFPHGIIQVDHIISEDNRPRCWTQNGCLVTECTHERGMFVTVYNLNVAPLPYGFCYSYKSHVDERHCKSGS